MVVSFLNKFRAKVISSVEKGDFVRTEAIDDKIALGVLLWVVAEADERFLPEEETKIKKG